MFKRVSGMFVVAFVVSCHNTPHPEIIDGSPDGNAPGVCDVLAQSGCDPGQRCTWIIDSTNPPIGHVGCVADGTIALGGTCTEPSGTGFDDCVKGTLCMSGVCERICGTQNAAPTCDADHSCRTYDSVLETSGNAIAGVCDPTCDPLTQDLKSTPAKPACGSTMPDKPDKGCFGVAEYSCAPSGSQTWGLVDRAAPLTDSSGEAYANGCAPGFVPGFSEGTGSMKTLCAGTCAALESDASKPPDNAKGNATVLAKLPTQAAAMVGNATCAIGKKGSESSSVCKFVWPYLVDGSGNLPPSFENSPYLDTLGLCLAIAHFEYDHTGGTHPDTPVPDCKDLPVPDANTPMYQDPRYWGCYTVAHSMFTSAGKAVMSPLLSDFRLRTSDNRPLKMKRHVLQ